MSAAAQQMDSSPGRHDQRNGADDQGNERPTLRLHHHARPQIGRHRCRCHGECRRHRCWRRRRLARCNRGRPLPFQPGPQCGDTGSVGRLTTQAAAHDVAEVGGKIRRQHRLLTPFIRPGGRLPSEGLDQRDTQRPDISGGGGAGTVRLGRVIHRKSADVRRSIVRRPDGIARQFELVPNHQDVGRLELALHLMLAMQERQDLQRRGQHLAGFLASECAMRQHLGQVLLGVLDHGEQEMPSAELTTARGMKADQPRMRHGSSGAPVRKLRLDQRRDRRQQLEHRLGKLRMTGQKDTAMVGGSEAAQQREFAVDDVSFPLRPELAHRSSFRLSTCPIRKIA